MANIKIVIGGIVGFAIILMLIKYVRNRGTKLTGLMSGKTSQTIQAADLDSADSSTSTTNFAYSIWMYVDDWNYRYGEPKVVFGRMTIDGNAHNPCPSVVLTPTQNNLAVSVAVYPDKDELEGVGANVSAINNAGVSAGGKSNKTHTCGVSNIPLQSWVNIIVSCYNRTMDVYLDGKLVRTCVLPGVAKVDTNAAVHVTPAGGFAGWTSKFQYWAHAINPQDAWNVYQSGYSDNLFGTFFGDYSLELNVKNGSEVVNTVSI